MSAIMGEAGSRSIQGRARWVRQSSPLGRVHGVAGGRPGGARMSRPPLPPFTAETAAQKVRLAEDAWNSRDPRAVSLAYSEESRWRNRVEFLQGRAAIVEFLARKWNREPDYRLVMDLET